MPVEQQPQQTTAVLFRAMCYRAFTDVEFHRDLRELAFKLVPGANSFEATMVGYISFFLCGPHYECIVRSVHGISENVSVQIKYTGTRSSADLAVYPGHGSIMQMFHDICSTIQKLAHTELRMPPGAGDVDGC